jgi:membrane glycosyltransferase
MKKRSLEIKWAIIFCLMTLLWMIGEKLAGLYSYNIALHEYITNLILIPSALIYVLALREKKKKDFNGKMSYIKILISGMILSLMISLLCPLVLYITYTFISPEYFGHAIQYAVSTKQASLAEAQKYFTFETYLFQGMFCGPIIGFIQTALIGLFLKTREESHFKNTSTIQ